jgi:hypothetical protein
MHNVGYRSNGLYYNYSNKELYKIYIKISPSNASSEVQEYKSSCWCAQIIRHEYVTEGGDFHLQVKRLVHTG